MTVKQLLCVAVSVSILLAGCGSPQKQIVGTWTFSELEFSGRLADSYPVRRMVEQGAEFLKGDTLTFNDDGTFVRTTSDGSNAGTYTLTERRVQLQHDGWGDMGRYAATLSEDGETLHVEMPTSPDVQVVYLKK